MTDITSFETNRAPSLSLRAANVLLKLAVALLVPMFLGVCAGDIALAAAKKLAEEARARLHAADKSTAVTMIPAPVETAAPITAPVATPTTAARPSPPITANER